MISQTNPMRRGIANLGFATLLFISNPSYGQEAAPAAPAPAAPAAGAGAAFRSFNTRDGKPFMAMITAKTDTTVTFKMQNGTAKTLRLGELSEVDQTFVRKWTKFKDALMTNTEFSTVTVKDLLELRGYQSFQFEVRGNHIFIEGEINGSKITYMVDTGAASSLLHVKAAEEAGVKIGPMDQTIYGVAGQQPAAICSVSTITLGDAKITNRKLLATDMSKFQRPGEEWGAILGADFLREMDAVISYREGRMFLRPDKINPTVKPDAKPGTPAGRVETRSEFRKWNLADSSRPPFTAALDDKNDKEAIFRFQDGKKAPLPLEKLSEEDRTIVSNWSKFRDDLIKNPEFATLTTKELLELRKYQSTTYRLDGNHILVDGLVGKNKARFLIDTGAGGGSFDLPFSKKLNLEMGPMDQVVMGIGGTNPACITKVPEMRIGDAIITARELLSCDHFRDQGALTNRNYDALFGAGFLRELDAVINYKEGRLFLRPDASDRVDDTKTGEPK